jgi:hypothetical protein
LKPGKHREVTSTSERHLAQVAFLNNPPSAFIPKAEVEKRPKDVSAKKKKEENIACLQNTNDYTANC